jgi:hypothetical protein
VVCWSVLVRETVGCWVAAILLTCTSASTLNHTRSSMCVDCSCVEAVRDLAVIVALLESAAAGGARVSIAQAE